MSNRNKRKQKSRRRGKRSNNRKGVNSVLGERISVGRLPIPPRTTTWLTYNEVLNIINVGGTAANVRYEPTFCYDINPTLGSTAMPFFTELAGLYRYYRAIRAQIHIEAVNHENFAQIIYVCPCNFDPTANYSATVAQQFLSNPLCRSQPLGVATGASTKVLNNRLTISMFSGSKWTGDADAYSARTDGTGGAPANNAWFTVGARTDGNVHTANGGIFISATLRIEICFFEETTPST